MDEGYQGFIVLTAGQIASGLANASAYEEERSRAEALAEIDRAKTAFFSNTSHEFRTPLTLMLGPLRTCWRDAAEGPSCADAAEIEAMHRNGVRLLKLVNTLLDFSRIEAGRAQAQVRADRPCRLYRRTGQHLPLRDAEGGTGIRGRMPALAARKSLLIAACGKRSFST